MSVHDIFCCLLLYRFVAQFLLHLQLVSCTKEVGAMLFKNPIGSKPSFLDFHPKSQYMDLKLVALQGTENTRRLLGVVLVEDAA